MKIKALIVDDEPLARERLRELLRAEADVDLAGECGDGREAVELIQQVQPDLVFLDVQMPERDGFEVLSELDPPHAPLVIFVTAFDQFALRAFEVHAIDYLLKPFDRERFAAALERARRQLKNRQAEDIHRRVEALLEDLGTDKPEGRPVTRLAIKAGGRVRLFRYDQIDWIEAADNYVNVHVGREALMHRDTMNAMEARLPADRFARISRSAIVNLDRIKELQPLFHGDHAVILHDGTKLTLSRNYRDRLSDWLQ